MARILLSFVFVIFAASQAFPQGAGTQPPDVEPLELKEDSPVSLNEVVKFSDQMVDTLNFLIRNPDIAAGKAKETSEKSETTVATKKQYKNINDETVYKTKARKASPLTTEQLTEMRDLLERKTDAWIKLEQQGVDLSVPFARGEFSQDGFEGRLDAAVPTPP